ncbi:MAG: hypoxanthine phosphoribosyltransferase [Thermodesulfobacteriota bacterium]
MKKLIISPEDIARRVKELGREISRDYQGKSLVLVGVLNGAFIFMADLVRSLDLPEEVEIDFIRVASYGKSSRSSGTITLSKDVEVDLAGRHLLLVEDIVDTGSTMAWLKDYFLKGPRQAPLSVCCCTLIDKEERRKIQVNCEYVGFPGPDGFLVGYGLDYAEQFRHLPGIYHLTLEH